MDRVACCSTWRLQITTLCSWYVTAHTPRRLRRRGSTAATWRCRDTWWLHLMLLVCDGSHVTVMAVETARMHAARCAIWQLQLTTLNMAPPLVRDGAHVTVVAAARADSSTMVMQFAA